MFIDLHTHSSAYSYDSFLTPEHLVIEAKKEGLDGICITEHDFFWEQEQLEALSRKHRLLIIPAVELNTEEGHALVFGLHQYVYGLHKPLYLKELVDAAGGAIVACHPYRRLYKDHDPDMEAGIARARQSPLYQVADAIEAMNGRGSQQQNAFSQKLATRLGIPAVGVSDSHDVADLGRCATYFEREIASLADLVRELKAGRYKPAVLRNGHGG